MLKLAVAETDNNTNNATGTFCGLFAMGYGRMASTEAPPEMRLPVLELALGAYLTSAIYFALDKGVYFSLPFLLLFQWGFIYVGLMSLLQGRFAALARALRRPAPEPTPAVE